MIFLVSIVLPDRARHFLWENPRWIPVYIAGMCAAIWTFYFLVSVLFRKPPSA